MTNDYKHFINILAGANSDKKNVPALFEPLINKAICEQLIWRKGDNLWDTPQHYLDTMFSLRERTKSDVITLDMRKFSADENQILTDHIASALSENDEIRAVMLCNSNEQVSIAKTSKYVCAIGGFGDVAKPTSHPFIRMDGSIANAIAENADGYYCTSSDAETTYANYSNKITIIGGLGLDWLNGSSPMEVHARLESLYALTGNRRYIVASGGFGEETDFLNFISLLSIYIRHR